MYLELLTENERKVFLDLAYQAMECDGEITQEELETIASYEVECRLNGYKRSKRTLDENLKLLKKSEMSHRKIVLVELIGIWSADNVWKNEELAMMDRVVASLGIPVDQASRIKRWAREFREVIADGFRLLQED